MTESLIQPNMFQLPDLTREIVIFFNLRYFKMFHACVNGSRIKGFGAARRFQWEGRSGKMTALGGMIGAPLAVMIVELAMASGAEKIHSFGSAGSTGEEMFDMGELVVPESACDETGICCDYLDAEPKKPVKSPFDVRQCRTISSVNSFFRLTRQNVKRYWHSKIQLIDMEAAPLNCVIQGSENSFTHCLLSVIEFPNPFNGKTVPTANHSDRGSRKASS